MDIEELHEACLSLPHVEETFPFDDVTLVFKVGGKMFALISLDSHLPHVSLKCDPDKAIELRSQYEGITGAFHMNKKHWNTVNADSDIPKHLVLELIRHSYDLVVEKLPGRIKSDLKLI